MICYAMITSLDPNVTNQLADFSHLTLGKTKPKVITHSIYNQSNLQSMLVKKTTQKSINYNYEIVSCDNMSPHEKIV